MMIASTPQLLSGYNCVLDSKVGVITSDDSNLLVQFYV